MRLLIFQHSAGEPPAAFGAHALAAGDTLHTVHLYAGAPIPHLSAFDALLVMGGPMDVWEEDTHPWLVAEKLAIREWYETGKPYLGICLGHQLLAEALGGQCRKMVKPEIAVSAVKTSNTKEDPLFTDQPESFAAMHWHGVEVTIPPDDARILGASQGCANQIMRVGRQAWGLQFHPELEPGTIIKWMDDPANIACASEWLGSDAAAWAFVDDAERQAGQFMDRSRALYRAFRAQC